MSQDTRLEVQIRLATFPADKAIVTELFLAYAQSLPISLNFQNFEHELASLPGKYAVENGGAVYLAYTTSSLSTPASIEETGNTSNSSLQTSASPTPSSSEGFIGCIALRPFKPPFQCELKRLYLTPSSRGLGVSKLLMVAALQHAREAGYTEMLLDTLRSMEGPRRIYEKYGFEEVEKYYESPEDCVYYRKVL